MSHLLFNKLHDPMSDQNPDKNLVSAYREGDQQAASELFERYYLRLLELIRRNAGWQIRLAEDSVDVAQSALRSFFAQIQDGQTAVGKDDSLWPLLVTIALNKIRNRGKFWQRKKRDPKLRKTLENGRDPLIGDPTPEDAAIVEELIDKLLEPFSERRQQILRLILEGTPVKEIAAEVGTTERTVYNTRLAAAEILERINTDDAE